MALISIKRNVDLQPGLNAPAVFNCSQGDKGTTMMLGLMNGGNDYTVPSGITITIRGSRSNGAVFTPTSATFSGSTVSFALTEEMTDTAGPTLCEAVLEQGNNVLGTANFIINVEASPMGADVPPVFTDAAWTWMLGKLTTETVPALGDDVISSIQGKVDKSQGSTNAKKFLRVNTSGNVSLASTDKTLSVADQIADAKETGDQIRALDAEIDGVATTLGGSISTLNGITTDLQSSKLNKNQGTSNAGKTMVVDSSGNIVPGDVPITIDDTLSIADAAADAKAAGDAIALKANASTIAPEFSDQNTYTAGSYVLKNGVLYRFTSAHSGAWTGSDAVVVTVGGEVEKANNALSVIDDELQIPGEYHLSNTSNASWSMTTIGSVTMKKGVTYTFDFNVPVALGYIVYIYLKDVNNTSLTSSQLPASDTSKTLQYVCNTENEVIKATFQVSVSTTTTINVDVTTNEISRIEKIENQLTKSSEINYGNSLFTSNLNAIGTNSDSTQRTCYKRKREPYVTGVKFACLAYPTHTYFCAFDENGEIIASYSLSGSTTVATEHSVTFGDDVAFYSVMCVLSTSFVNAYLIETLSSYGDIITQNENNNSAFHDKTYAEIKKSEMKAWSDMQLGMFIHWGVYSAWAGVYDGLNIDGEEIHVTGGTEWMWQQYRIPKDTYMLKDVDFTGVDWNPDYICMLAKKIGMKQIVITARHHEGFSLMESDNCEWDITDSSCTRDVLMELKKACERHHLKFSLYVSPLLDWCDDGGYGQSAWHDGTDPYTFAEHKAFVEAQLKYLNQLVEKYDPYVIWYDGGTYLHNSVDGYLKELFNNNQLKEYPYIIVNERGEGVYDYRLAENTYSDRPNTAEKFERCSFLCGWGYNTGHDYIANYKTQTQIIWDMLENMGRGFNYLLNISPRGDGSIPSPTETRFNQISAFMQKYTFFNGAKRVFNYCQPNWGRPLYINNSLYLFIVPTHSGTIYLDSVCTDNIKSVHVYDINSPDSASNYEVIGSDRLKIMNVPTTSDDYFSVVRIDYDGDLISLDYNIIDSEISGMSMVRTVYTEWASTVTAVLIDGTYRFGTDDSVSVSRFKFNGTTGTYSFVPHGTQSGTVNFSYKLYDGYNNLISSGTSFSLTNGKIYMVEISKTGTGTYIMDKLNVTSA